MTITNTTLLDAYANIADRTYFPNSTTPDVSAGAFGTYTEIVNQALIIPTVDGPLGFQARAFFNSTTNELVIAFAGTEGFSDANAPEFLADMVTNFTLAVSGTGPQVATAEAFITQAITAANGTEGEVVAFNAPGAGGFLGLPLSGTSCH